MIRICWRLADAAGRRKMIAIYALLLSENAVALTRPIIIGHVVSTVAALQPDFHARLEFWLCAMVANMGLCWALIGPQRMLERDFACRIRQTFTERLYNDLTMLPWSWHQNNHSGKTIERLDKAAKSLFAFADHQFQYTNSFVRLAGSIVLLLLIAPQVGIVIALAVPPIYYLIRRFDFALTRVAQTQNEAERNIATGLVDYIGNMASLIALRLTRASRIELSARFDPWRRAMNRGIVVEVTKWTLFVMSLNIATAFALLFFLTHSADIRSAVLAGTVVTVFQYLQQIDGSLQTFANIFQNLLGYKVDLAGTGVIATAAATGNARAKSSTGSSWADLTLAHLSFRYEDQAHHVHQLSDLSLELRRGQRVALVGSSGSGKSTLLRLMRGLHDPASGSLQIDGTPAEFATLADLSTLVLQDAEIFENTLQYNIVFGMEADPADVARAVHVACLQPVLDGVPQGLETDIRERGVNLSGGQKQRLALARGLYAGRESSLLLLDEPTSSLDTVTEAQIFDRLFVGRPDACIVASLHRLHLLERFDRVYVMDAGRIVEQGSFAELIQANGKLAQLWQAQKHEESLLDTTS